MKRKLFSTMLCAFALLLLMGAGVEPDTTAAPVIEEESTSTTQIEQVLETGIPTGNEQSDEIASEENAEHAAEAAVEDVEALAIEEPELDHTFLIDGMPAHADTDRKFVNGVTYVAMGAAIRDIAPEATVTWDKATKTATVKTGTLTMTAQVGQLYAVANGRYLYAKDGIQMEGDRVFIPLKILTRAFDANLTWDKATDVIRVQRGFGAIKSGDQFYNQDDLFWLSRVIYAESGNQSLEGKMAVGNVIMNRVNSPIFPNSILGVISQRNQFSTYRGGALANRTPNWGSVVAAMLVMDGGEVEETQGALYFDSLVRSWASRNKTFVCKLGGHSFYK